MSTRNRQLDGVLALHDTGIGDQVMMLPAVRALARARPGQVWVVSPRALAPLLYGDLELAGWIPLEELDAAPNKALEVECVLSLSPWWPDEFDALLARTRAARSIGYAAAMREQLTPDLARHAVDLAFDVVRRLEPSVRVDDFAWPIAWPTDDLERARARLRHCGARRVLAIHCETSSTKCASPDFWRKLVDDFLGRRPDFAACVVSVDGADLRGGPYTERIVDCRGQTLTTAAALVSSCDLAACVDSCMLHICDLARVPTVGVFTASDPRLFGLRFARGWHVSGNPNAGPETGPAASRALDRLCGEIVVKVPFDDVRPDAPDADAARVKPASVEQMAELAVSGCFECDPRGPVAVFTMLGQSHVPYALLALKSLWKRLARPYALHWLDDGSLTAEDTNLLLSRFIGSRVLTLDQIVGRVALDKRHPECSRFLATNLLARRIFAPLAVDSVDRLMILDTDVLFFKPPDAIEAWARGEGPTTLFNKDSCEHGSLVLGDEEISALGGCAIRHFNAGLLCTRRERIDLDLLERSLLRIRTVCAPATQWTWEQTAWAVMVAVASHAPLPDEYSFVNEFGPAQSEPPRHGDLVSRHYSGKRRRDFFREGVQRILEEAAQRAN